MFREIESLTAIITFKSNLLKWTYNDYRELIIITTPLQCINRPQRLVIRAHIQVLYN